MLIFIDESGDPVFKLTRGSSKIFVLALVIFNTEKDAQNTARVIESFKKRVWKDRNREIKFHGMGKKEKIDFLETVKNCNFRIRVMVVKKENIDLRETKRDKKNYYNYLLKQLLIHNKDTIKGAKLELDGTGPKELRNALIAYLRKKGKNKMIKDLRFVDSEKNILIQLADMISGSIYRAYQKDKSDSLLYKDIIEKKVEDEWVFEKNST